MAQLPKRISTTGFVLFKFWFEHSIRISIHERFVLRTIVGIEKNVTFEINRVHGKILSDSQNRMELGTPQIYKENQNSRLQRWELILKPRRVTHAIFTVFFL